MRNIDNNYGHFYENPMFGLAVSKKCMFVPGKDEQIHDLLYVPHSFYIW
jgi:hypothetical protein